ncbi:MAG: hypothetical protein AB7V36_10590 [Bacteroidales bacterium]
MDTAFDKSRELIKEATANKTKDINKAIYLIEQAINICPEIIIEDKFKLANYYHFAGNKEKAYNILLGLITVMNKKSTFTIRNAVIMQIYGQICTLCFSDKKFSDYIFYYSLQRYHTNLAIFTQGRKQDYEMTKDTFDAFGASYSTKINSCFKNIHKESIIKEFSDKFNEFFKYHSDDLLFILEISYSAHLSKDYNLNSPESIGERVERILQSDNEFIEIITKYSDEYFINFFNQILKPLIENCDE